MTELISRRRLREIPSYSLTGDLLSYERCPLQYRYFTRGKVHESHPVQRWYGQFLHRGMRGAYESYRRGSSSPLEFQWSDPLTSPTDQLLEATKQSLRAEGIHRPGTLSIVAEQRLIRSIRVLGPLIYPLVKEAEVRLGGPGRTAISCTK